MANETEDTPPSRHERTILDGWNRYRASCGTETLSYIDVTTKRRLRAAFPFVRLPPPAASPQCPA